MAESKLTGLTIPELFATSPCDWIIFSKAKTGPDVRWWCRFCSTFAKQPACPMSGSSALQLQGGSEQ